MLLQFWNFYKTLGIHTDPRALYHVKPVSLPTVTFGSLNPLNQAFPYTQGKNKTIGNGNNTQSLCDVTSRFLQLCIHKKEKKKTRKQGICSLSYCIFILTEVFY